MAAARLQSVDFYRGVALIAMAAYHTVWDLAYYGLSEAGIGVDPVWITLQRSILTAFLLLAGASLTLAHGDGVRWRGFWKRELLLIGAAALVSIGTWFLFGPAFAWFGVLHLIALGSLMVLPVLVLPLWAQALVAVVCLGLPVAFSSELFNPPIVDWIGFFTVTPETADLVPVFPWFGVMLIGLIGMKFLRSLPVFTWSSAAWPFRALALLGRWSLLFYLLHQPILFGIITPIANWVNGQEQAKITGFLKTCQADCLSGRGLAEGAGALQFCTAYCQCALDITVRESLWNPNPDEQKHIRGLCTAMSE